jgi:hypothetical protein
MLINKRRFSAEHFIDSFGGGIRWSGTRRVAVSLLRNPLRLCGLSLAPPSRCHLPVELHRLVPGHTQRLPSMAGEVSCQQNDLSYMKRIMRHLAVYNLHGRLGVRREWLPSAPSLPPKVTPEQRSSWSRGREEQRVARGNLLHRPLGKLLRLMEQFQASSRYEVVKCIAMPLVYSELICSKSIHGG